MDRSNWIIIGIAGVTCGGKTSLANRLKNTLSPVYVFNQDKYFYPDDSPKHVKCKSIDHNNYDILSSLDMEQMYRDVLSTMRGEDKSLESYTQPTAGRKTVPGKKFIVVEGFTVINDKKIFDLCDLKYYITLEYGECLSRRVLRVYDPPDVPGYFEEAVWPSHIMYRAQMEREPTVQFLPGTNSELITDVLSDLIKLGLQTIPS